MTKKQKSQKKNPQTAEFQDLSNTVKGVGMLGITMTAMRGVGSMMSATFKK